MPIETSGITSSQLQRILSVTEDHFKDIKSIDIKPAKLTKSLSAFANADGGELYIGVDEVEKGGGTLHEWRGFSNPEAANGHIQCIEEFFPLGDGCYLELLSGEHAAGLLLKVTVHKSRSIKDASDGKVYLRRGAQNVPISSETQLRELRLTKGIDSFELETVQADVSEITNSLPIIEFLVELIPTPPDPEEWLVKNNLIQRNMPTVAGLVLFAEVPQALIPKRCGIKLYRYNSRYAQSVEK